MKLPYLVVVLAFITSCTPKERTSNDIQLLEMTSPANGNSSLPHLVKGEDGNLYMSWVEKQDSGLVILKYASLVNNQWSDPEVIATGNNWFVNWADYPILAVDRHGNKIASYPVKSSSGTYSYDVNLSIKSKFDSVWSLPIIPHSDNTPTEHGFVSLIPNNNETFTVAWLDGRNTGGMNHDHHGDAAMTLRSAVIDMNGHITEKAELDARVCDCCQTGGIMANEGPVIVYRDRSVDEIRDMAYVTKMDGEWTEPKLVATDNWNIDGCPVNGPRIKTFENTTAVAWYTQANSRAIVKVSFKDSDEFQEPIIIDSSSPMGRVDIVLTDRETAYVSWLDGGDKPTIKLRKVQKNGTMSPTQIVAQTSESRSSGFPQMEIISNELYFAWTSISSEDASNILLKKLAL